MEVKKSYRDTEPSDEDAIEKLKALEDILEDPKARSAVLEQVRA